MKQLEGAAALCDFMKAEENVETMNAERYLYYMETEKQQGRSFVDVLELAEDLVDYTGDLCFHGNPGLWTMLGVSRMQPIWTICWWFVLSAVFLISVFIDPDCTVIPIVIVAVIWLMPLIRFAVAKRSNRKRRRRHELHY